MKILVALLPILLVGCSFFVKKNCGELNWFALGEKDGKEGKASHHFVGHQASCKGSANRSEYIRGMQQGLKDYCRSENAFKLGESGAGYYNPCSQQDEVRFRRRFDLGYQIYRLKVEIEDRKDAIEELKEQYRYDSDLNDQDKKSIEQHITSMEQEQVADQELIKKLYHEAKLSGLIEVTP